MMLVIGNKRLSSWSLRPWLVLKHFGIPFEEKLIFLDQPTTSEDILKFSPTAKVPALNDRGINVWDSLAICEYVNEKFPQKMMWPQDPEARATARSISAEMHSGFATMRRVMSHDLQRQHETFVSHEALADIQRIKDIWSANLKKYKGPYLFGEFSIADAMYAPVVNRFVSYAVPMESDIAAYVKRMRELPAHKEWIAEGLKETIDAPLHP